ncbi:divergent polysaccharide deacetylase family protein [Aurantimonas sp. VKM B-3413]|uniref:divergent polysaccharide deacetylase family protein n=1 Tax=Aurantimonas sp. VKM B-3413 TaxID=2779401 RepID=UPI001E44B846|nr:divergent polysaccharide deacetylase family protein [Aurantimonas sp. VKM B-3413]MCB8836661.1 divergent polysaccharide deacetylase family protein [Aurantimonas sp. VKM B-3413]
MDGELYRPLGMTSGARQKRRAAPLADSWRLVGVAGLVAAASLWAALAGQPARRVVDQLAPRSAPTASNPTSTATTVPDSKVAQSRLPPVTRTGGPTIIGPSSPSGPVTFRVEDAVSLRQAPSMAHMPDPGLLEDTEFGQLPVRGADGRRPFDVYAGTWSGKPATRIAIIVGGIGISQTSSMAAVDTLPRGVTLAFAPTGNSLDRWMQAARRGGHELLLQAPLEPIGYPQVDPGADTLTVKAASENDFAALYAAMGRITNYVGVMNYMGGRFTADPAAMQPLISELGRRGLMYLDDASSSRSVAKDTAALEKVPYAGANVLLDAAQDPNEIKKQLDVLERVARGQGQAIGVASAFEGSIRTIAAWIPEAEKRGIEIVPVTALASDPEDR